MIDAISNSARDGFTADADECRSRGRYANLGLDEPIRISTAGKLPEMRIDGRPRQPSSVSRYGNRGVRTTDGRRVYLRTTRIGGTVTTTRRDVQRFIEELNRTDGEAPRRAREHDTADADLAALGI